MDNVFISGITGQDGIFLTSNLLKKNSDIKIYGTTRNADNLFYKKLNFLDNKADTSRVNILQADLSQYDNVLEIINTVKPSKIFNLSGPSSPSESMHNGKNFISIINIIFDNLIKASNVLKQEFVFFQRYRLTQRGFLLLPLLLVFEYLLHLLWVLISQVL